MPGCRCAAIASTAETMYDMSGSFVLRSGVGTQMLTVSSVRDDREVGRGAQPPVVDERRDVARSGTSGM